MTKQDFINKWELHWFEHQRWGFGLNDAFEAELDLLLDAAYDKGWSDATKQATDEIHKNYQPNN